MYKIIGADQREYGPVSAAELRQWFREGRANAQSLIRAEGGSEWKPLAAYPEFASLLAGSSTPSAPPTIGPTTGEAVRFQAVPAEPVPVSELEERDYDINILGCLRRAWDLMMKNFGPLFGISLLVLLANGAIAQIIWTLVAPSYFSSIIDAVTNPQGSDPFAQLSAQLLTPESIARFALATFFSACITPLFEGGLLLYYLKVIRGEKAALADAFSGFRLAPLQLLWLGLVKSFLLGVGWSLLLLPGLYLMVIWAFSIPLLMDRKMNFLAAMNLSQKIVSKHWLLICGLVLINALVGSIGEIFCCCSLLNYLTMPIAFLSLLYAYEDIFGQRIARAA